MSKALRGLPTILVGMLLIAVLFTAYTAQQSLAGHEPANKVTASGSEIEVFGPGEDVVLLSEEIKVSTTHDLILQASLECTIVTALRTGDDDQNGTDADTAEGNIDIWLEIDGQRVAVSSDDLTETGEVTACNQVHQQQQTDSESNNPQDGIDTLDDYLRTKTAVAFNWLALDVGVEDPDNDNLMGAYDDPANGNNILLLELKANLDDTTAAQDICNLGDEGCSEAIVGHRTLIAEPTNASNHETVDPAGP